MLALDYRISAHSRAQVSDVHSSRPDITPNCCTTPVLADFVGAPVWQQRYG